MRNPKVFTWGGLSSREPCSWGSSLGDLDIVSESLFGIIFMTTTMRTATTIDTTVVMPMTYNHDYDSEAGYAYRDDDVVDWLGLRR